MTKHPKVTLLVGTYKESELLIPTIEGFLSQTYKDFRVFVVDDNSPSDKEVIERSKSIVEAFNDSRLHYVLNDVNIGVPHVYRKWISLVNTEYFYICGAGDKLTKNALELMVNFLEEHPQTSMVHGLETKGNGVKDKSLFSESGSVDPKLYLEYHLIGGHKTYSWSQAAAMFRTEFWKIKNIPVTNYHYWDHYFHCTYLLHSDKVGYLNNYLAVRHVDPNLTTWARNKPFINRLERMIQTSKFIDEYETYLIRKGYPANKYRLINALRIFRRLGYCKKADEFHLAFRIAIIDTVSVLLTGFARLVAYPFLKLFGIIRKN